jgi:glycosyltransferase involved in cell wall biosynthesis
VIRAFQELDLPGSELILFGGTATRKIRSWLRELIEGSDNIKARSGDPRLAYERASVLVHTSLNDNICSTVTEALAYGLPVIETENTGTKEFIKEGVNGFIIPTRDIGAMKEKIRYYYG